MVNAICFYSGLAVLPILRSPLVCLVPVDDYFRH